MKIIDLRSDTVTLPTQEMRAAMAEALLGDDVYGDDPTVIQLEELAARIVGKEAALLVPSGTFGNQLALFTHCQRGNEVILGDDCHIVAHEVGAASVIAGVNLRTLSTAQGKMDPAEVAFKIRPQDLHFPETGLICLENAHSNGRVISLENMEAIHRIASSQEVPVHLDGARLFNGAAFLQVDPREMTQYADSVMFCLSKGLCAPFGSILAGSQSFIDKARKKRKLMGGGLRQAGIMAAAGLVALEKMRFRLQEDHENAKLLGAELNKIPGIRVLTEGIQVNMVFFDMKETGLDSASLVSALLQRGIKINGEDGELMRFVTHQGVSRADVLQVADTMAQLFQGASRSCKA